VFPYFFVRYDGSLHAAEDYVEQMCKSVERAMQVKKGQIGGPCCENCVLVGSDGRGSSDAPPARRGARCGVCG
jgi:hypothetical protein